MARRRHPTYHLLDPRNGGLQDEAVVLSGPVTGTEKVDGTNARIIMVPGGDWLLGSREELLYARGATSSATRRRASSPR